jgi:hypothetical protein
VSRLIATTSAKDGRETIISLPSLEEYMSSTYWSWPSPIASRMARKYASRSGLVAISCIRSSRSGMMLIVPSFSNVPGARTSAVPSQLLPTKTTRRTSPTGV